MATILARGFDRTLSSADLTSPEAVFDPPVSRLSTLRYARKLGVIFVLLAMVIGAVSFLVLLGLTPLEPTFPVIIGTMAVNGVFVLMMGALVGREVYTLIQARRRGRAAARLHVRIVGLFGIVAAFPAIMVAIVAGITLDLGLDRIFDTRSRTIVESSVSVAKSYAEEATGTLLGHTNIMANGLRRNRQMFDLDREGFTRFMSGQGRGLRMIGASIVRTDGSVVVKADIPVRGTLPAPPLDLLKEVGDGKPSCILPRIRNLAACAITMDELGEDHILFTLRLVDSSVLNTLQLMEELTKEYETLESGRLPLQIAFALLYFGICLTVLLSAIWMGIAVADRLVAPIRQLIAAADEVRAGNLDVTVPTIRSEGDLRSLSDTFNAMTSDLRTQRNEILDNQELIDQRRRFTEAVLSGVSAGVVGVSAGGLIAITNSSALELLGGSDDVLVGKPLDAVSNELSDVLKNANLSGRRQHLEQVTILRDGRERTFNVQVTLDDSDEHAHSYVITIDDITDLVSAQRTSAWADVARRIAHEIKNPLTPIQLSAERIRRRYGKVITEDREVFDQCTDTIIRQVADIGRMVDEFSSFARMPKPTMTKGDLVEAVREATFLLKVGHEEINFDVDLPKDGLIARFDNRLLSQAFGNLIKNATEAIEGADYTDGKTPEIKIRASSSADMHRIDIIDNGKGLPKENRQRLLEPYMTTREKGTGLGLAIVSKILEEHGGDVQLADAPQVAQGGRGAMLSVFIPRLNDEALENKDVGDDKDGV